MSPTTPNTATAGSTAPPPGSRRPHPLLRPLTRACRLALLIGCLGASAYPLIWMATAAFRTDADVNRNPFGLPEQVVLDNVTQVLRTGPFARAYVNSVVVALGGVAVAVSLGSAAAYGFAQMRFRGRNILFMLFLLGMIVPVHVTLIPLNRLMGSQGLGLKGSLWALIGPYAGFALPITVLILRGAFEAVPRELMEAGRMDGCTHWGLFTRIALPLVKPALATVVIFNFLTMWNEFAFALTLLDPDAPTLPLAITQFRGEHDLELTLTCAALVIAVAPLLAVYVVAQKHIVRGLTAGAVKE